MEHEKHYAHILTGDVGAFDESVLETPNYDRICEAIKAGLLVEVALDTNGCWVKVKS